MGIRFYLEDRLRSALENLAYRLADEFGSADISDGITSARNDLT